MDKTFRLLPDTRQLRLNCTLEKQFDPGSIEEAFPATDTPDFVGSVRCGTAGTGRFTAMALEMDSSTRIFTTLTLVAVDERMAQE